MPPKPPLERMTTRSPSRSSRARWVTMSSTGPMNRVADNALAKQLLGWEPQTLFEEGLRRTWEWYIANKQPEDVEAIFEFMLTGRGKAAPVSASASA